MTLTASKLVLARLCPGHVHLPQHDSRSEYADEGIARHKAWEDAIDSGHPPEELDERWPGFMWRAEIPFAWDIATGKGRQLPKGQHRDYSMLTSFEIGGTADCVGLSPNRDKLVVIDRKSFDRVPAAVANLQVGIAALALSSSEAGITDVEVGIYYEAAPFDVAQLDEFSLAVFAETIREVVKNSASSKELREGEHCRWCNAFPSCPKKQSLALEVMTETADERLAMLLPLNDDATAARAYEFAERVRMLLKRLDAALYARASEAPIPLGEGRMFGKVDKLSNETLSGDIVWNVVKELHGQAIADAAVVRTATKTRLKEALGFAGGKGKVAAMERTVLDAVRAAGGAKREMKTTIDEYQLQLAGEKP